VGKTIFIPLWHVASYAQIRQTITELWPQWSQILLTSCGKYLGFLLGPGGKELMWKKVIAKTDRRVTDWCQLHAGMFFSILAHNHHIVPVCTYIAQLVPPDESITRHLDKIVSKMFPGPGNWTTLSMMRSLKHFGFPCQLVDLKLVSTAAMQRYYHNSALDIRGMATELYLHSNAYGNSTATFPELTAWHDGAFAMNIIRSIDACADLGVHQDFIRSTLSNGRADGKMPGIQKIITARLHNQLYGKASADNAIRKRLERWQLERNPRVSLEIALHNLQTIGKTCRAAVQAAYFRTLLNGWVTARRMRSVKGCQSGFGQCVFGCGQGRDSIEHYVHCRITVAFFRRVGLPYAQPSMSAFLLIRRKATRERIRIHASCLYALYLTHCILRHSTQTAITEERVNKLLRCFCKVRDALVQLSSYFKRHSYIQDGTRPQCKG
jgi:hypothetical protein